MGVIFALERKKYEASLLFNEQLASVSEGVPC